MDTGTKEIVEAFWRAMNDNDFRRAGRLFTDDFVCDYPQSRERILGRGNWVALNEEYPAAGRWSFQVQRLIVEGDAAVSEVTVSDTATQSMLISFVQVREGLIRNTTEYWPDPYAPPGHAGLPSCLFARLAVGRRCVM